MHSGYEYGYAECELNVSRPRNPVLAESLEFFPATGRLAAVDYGTVRIGIAVCDPMRILVSPLEIHAVSSRVADGEYFARLAKREAIDGFVVGLPVHLDGGESQKSIEVRRFGRWLHEVTGVPVRLFDERFTSSTAEDMMRSRNQVDPRSRSKKPRCDLAISMRLRRK